MYRPVIYFKFDKACCTLYRKSKITEFGAVLLAEGRVSIAGHFVS